MGKDRSKKSRKNDLLISPLNYIWKYDRTVSKDILIGIVAAMNYNSENYNQLKSNVIKSLEVNIKELTEAEKSFKNFLNKAKSQKTN